MKTPIIALLLLFAVSSSECQAQNTGDESSQSGNETYGRTLNFGFGIGYYSSIGGTLPVIHANFEFDVARNFTLAPFITAYSYRRTYYWGNPNYPYRNYSYTRTVVPVGVKGTYYFDQFLKAGSDWDFYLGASLGFAFRSTTWEDGYYGETSVNNGSSTLYFDGHIGTEYHLNRKFGLFLDMSSGISTFGLATHI
jgi:hypothetical protein